MNTKTILALAVTGMMVFGSCKKKGTGIEESTTPTGTLMMHLHTNIADSEVEEYDSIFVTDEGRKMSLKLAQMYISGIQLVKLDGSTYDVSTKFLKVLETEGYKIENVPVGNYKALRFKVGLDATTNALDPTNTTYASILNNSSMWFSNPVQPKGYVFAAIQGSIDTTTAMNGSLIPFSYKIGTNSNLVDVVLPEKNYTVSKDLISYAHIIIDYSKIFDGIEVNKSENLTISTTEDNSTSLATAIKNNISQLFHLE